ncbi:MAG: hypothetical protein ACI8QC_003381 [Planctomycetota bacterium]|jgi:hypothetical protein
MNHLLLFLSTRHSVIPFVLAFVGCFPSTVFGQEYLAAWGSDLNSQVSTTPEGGGFTQLSANYTQTLALRTDGSIAAWGAGWLFEDFGQVSNTPTTTGFIHVSAGYYHSMALRSNGAIEVWGDNSTGLITNKPFNTGFTQLAAGWGHSLGLRGNTSIAAWGDDFFGQVTNKPSGQGFLQVAAGEDHCLALRSDGSIVSWGRDHAGQVSMTPTGTGFIQVAGGRAHSVALRTDGSIVSWGNDPAGVVTNTPTETGFVEVRAGAAVSLALRADGSMVAWGGDSANEVSDTPTQSGFTLIAVGTHHGVALGPGGFGFAFCSGSLPAGQCACFSPGAVGSGCVNSVGPGAKLRATGTASLASDTLALTVTGLPINKPGLILRGANTVNGGVGNPVGEGLLCVAGSTARSHVQLSTGGAVTFTDFQGAPFSASSYGAGTPTNYQFWYRDAKSTCTTSGFNFSNAWRTNWLP